MLPKGGIISEILLKSPPKNVPYYYPDNLLFMLIVLSKFLVDFSQSETLFRIKPPLQEMSKISEKVSKFSLCCKSICETIVKSVSGNAILDYQ